MDIKSEWLLERNKYKKEKKKKTEKDNETRERITALSFKGKTKTRKEPENEKKKGWYEHFLLTVLFFDCWMIYCVVFLYALLNCFYCYCNFIGQVGIRKSVRLHGCQIMK